MAVTDSREPLTGAELLETLSAMTPEQLERRVVIEGCDCAGDALAVNLADELDPPAIWIERR